MDILLLCYEYPPLGGGGGVGAQKYAEAWAAKGHQVTVLTSGKAGLAAAEVVGGVDVRRVTVAGRRSRATASVLSMSSYNVAGAAHLLRHRRTLDRCQVVNGHFSLPTGPLAAFAARLLQVPNVLTIIGGDIYDPSKRSSPHRSALLRWINRWLIDDADRVIAISSDTKRRAEQWYGITRPIEVVNYGFQRTVLSEGMPETSDHETFRLVSVGRLVRRKGFEHLIKALAMLPEQVELTVVGDGPCAAELQQLAEDQGVAARVTFTGFQTDAQVHQRLRRADCYVLASLHEGLGIVVQEAMDAGLPVIATNNGGQVDLIRMPRNGILVEPGSAVELATAIRTLHDDRELARTMGANNRVDIAAWDIDQNCERYIDIFREVTAMAELRTVAGGTT